MIETGVIHGRFQLLHNDHLKYLLAGKSRCKHLIVGITNPDPTLTKDDSADSHRSSPEANPFTYWERYQMVRDALLEAGIGWEEFSIVPLPINFPELFRYYVPLDATFFLTIYDQWGERKLAMFQELGLIVEVLWRKTSTGKGLSASEIRRDIAEGRPWQQCVPPSVVRFVEKYRVAERLAQIAQNK